MCDFHGRIQTQCILRLGNYRAPGRLFIACALPLSGGCVLFSSLPENITLSRSLVQYSGHDKQAVG